MDSTRWSDAFLLTFRQERFVEKCVRQAGASMPRSVGPAGFFAWQRRVFERASRGEPLFGEEGEIKRDGAPVLVAVVLLLAIPAGLLAIAAATLTVLGLRVKGYLPEEIVQPALVAYGVLLYPEVLRRALAHGESVALLRPGPSVRAIARAPFDYAKAVALTFAALLVLAVGFNVCVVGALVTIPVSHAISACVAAKWNAVVQRVAARAPMPYR